MALAVLDGNQSATTLSSVVTGGEHIVAHSVVSLGTTAISNIATAVSGVSVSISGTPSTTFGAVTGSVSILGTPIVTIPGLARLGNSVATNGTADSNLDFIKIGGHQDGQNQVAHIVHVSAGGAMKVDASESSVTFSQASVTFGVILGTVTIGNSVTISNFPSTQTVAGTVTANGGDFVFSESQDTSSAKGVLIGFEDDASTEYRKVTDAQPLPISISAINNTGGFSGSLPVSGTVTANNPNGALTTHFGSVTTASVAQLTSCVTNTSRKYLLAQNISAGTVTIGIGFSPTTTQGIQLAAGGGLTFDAFCPTGAVYWLGAVTGAAFTILEG